jgi:hypothetical protein
MYTYKIKNQELKVIKVIDHNNKVYWRFEINNGGSEDWYPTKSMAKFAGIELINEEY